jgi:hypothetical protein
MPRISSQSERGCTRTTVLGFLAQQVRQGGQKLESQAL